MAHYVAFGNDNGIVRLYKSTTQETFTRDVGNLIQDAPVVHRAIDALDFNQSARRLYVSAHGGIANLFTSTSPARPERLQLHSWEFWQQAVPYRITDIYNDRPRRHMFTCDQNSLKLRLINMNSLRPQGFREVIQEQHGGNGQCLGFYREGNNQRILLGTSEGTLELWNAGMLWDGGNHEAAHIQTSDLNVLNLGDGRAIISVDINEDYVCAVTEEGDLIVAAHTLDGPLIGLVNPNDMIVRRRDESVYGRPIGCFFPPTLPGNYLIVVYSNCIRWYNVHENTFDHLLGIHGEATAFTYSRTSPLFYWGTADGSVFGINLEHPDHYIMEPHQGEDDMITSMACCRIYGDGVLD